MHSAFYTRCDFRPVQVTSALAGTAPLISKIAFRTHTVTECRSGFKRTLGPMACLLAAILNSGLRAASAKRSAEIHSYIT